MSNGIIVVILHPKLMKNNFTMLTASPKQLLYDGHVCSYGKLRVREVPLHRIHEFSLFVVDVYNNTAMVKKGWKPLSRQEIHEIMLEDELLFHYGHYFELINTENKVVGTIKIVQKKPEVKLPIESVFKVDIREQCHLLDIIPDEIWHFSRLAIDKQNLKGIGTKALTILFFHALCIANRKPGNVFVAECDAEICRKLELIGINCIKVGLPRIYVGSPTFPMIVTGKSMVQYLKKASKLVETGFVYHFKKQANGLPEKLFIYKPRSAGTYEKYPRANSRCGAW
jgi:hypothetical protein